MLIPQPVCHFYLQCVGWLHFLQSSQWFSWQQNEAHQKPCHYSKQQQVTDFPFIAVIKTRKKERKSGNWRGGCQLTWIPMMAFLCITSSCATKDSKGWALSLTRLSRWERAARMLGSWDWISFNVSGRMMERKFMLRSCQWNTKALLKALFFDNKSKNLTNLLNASLSVVSLHTLCPEWMYFVVPSYMHLFSLLYD